MTVKLVFSDHDLEPVIQYHLETGISVQAYIKAAVRYLTAARAAEDGGKNSMGYGDASRFKQYNTLLPTADYLPSGDD